MPTQRHKHYGNLHLDCRALEKATRQARVVAIHAQAAPPLTQTDQQRLGTNCQPLSSIRQRNPSVQFLSAALHLKPSTQLLNTPPTNPSAQPLDTAPQSIPLTRASNEVPRRKPSVRPLNAAFQRNPSIRPRRPQRRPSTQLPSTAPHLKSSITAENGFFKNCAHSA